MVELLKRWGCWAMSRLCFAVLILCAALGLSGKDGISATSEPRIALVVGNAAYKNAPPLKNSINDAKDMANTLRELGFDVIEIENATKQQLEHAIGQFSAKLAEGSVGLFYYSGHGIQENGRNFLIPVEAELASEAAVRLETVEIDLILDLMNMAQTRVNLVILDACRSNPFERRFRALGRGLAPIEQAPRGTLIAYSTAPGKVASDGDGSNGLYTAELLKAMRLPGLKVEEVFKTVRIAVSRASHDYQTPWESSSLTGDFFFKPSAPIAEPSAPSPDQLLWEAIQDEKEIGPFEIFLTTYPTSKYVKLARNKLAILEREKTIKQQEADVTGATNPMSVLPQPAAPSLASPQQPYPSPSPIVAFPPRPPRKPPIPQLPRDTGTENAQQLAVLPLPQARSNSPVSPEASYRRGHELFLTRSYAEAVPLLRSAADQGYAEAENLLGVMYRDGDGVNKDLAEASRLIGLAANQGLAAAEANQAFDYEWGLGTPQDRGLAVEWYRKAAAQGDAGSKEALLRLVPADKPPPTVVPMPHNGDAIVGSWRFDGQFTASGGYACAADLTISAVDAEGSVQGTIIWSGNGGLCHGNRSLAATSAIWKDGHLSITIDNKNHYELSLDKNVLTGRFYVVNTNGSAKAYYADFKKRE